MFSSYRLIERKFIYPRLYGEQVEKYCDKYKVEESLIYAVIKAESGFKEDALSQRGAMGLMQITPATGKYIAEKIGKDFEEEKLMTAESNIEYGVYYMSYLLKTFDNEDTAICAYNAGEGRIRSWLKDERYSNDGISLKACPYKETAGYLKKVKKYNLKYKKLYY